MNILSAIFSGQTGFLKAADAMAQKAARISEFSSSAESQENIAQDLAGIKLDKITAEANLRSVKISEDLLSELIQVRIKK
ncbi:MAG: hypothetical protein J0L93_03155 [Deltaproteobacteria bacterium]|nr:hypothetical protein [Deltaproteobacteria bacterium]